MLRQLQDPDFCIAVCTETYKRRFDGNEAPGQGLGATWEGRWIRQILYESKRNDRIIPVVFESTDVNHIPLVLRDVTRYDLSTDDGYSLLHRALTRQPLVQRPPVGPMRKRLPELDPGESVAAALLRLCPDPLPLRLTRSSQRRIDLPATLARLLSSMSPTVQNGLVHSWTCC